MKSQNLKQLEKQQRQLIVHSFIYYELNDSIWSDKKYDNLSLEIELRKDTDIWKQSKFYSVFKDWDSSTGMNLVKEPDSYGRGDYYWHFRGLAEQLLL